MEESRSPASVSVRRVSPDASEGEVNQILEVFNWGFETNPHVCYMVGGYNGHVFKPNIVPQCNVAIVRAGLIGGHVYAAETPDGKIVGAAVWFGPGEELLSSPEQFNAGWSDFMGTLCGLDPDMQAWWMEYFLPEYTALTKKLLPEPRTKTNTWHLQWFAILPEYQRRGIGRTMIKDCEQRALADPNSKPENLLMSVETETEDARMFYEACGFEVSGTMENKAPKTMGGSLTMWVLKKEIK